MFVEVIHNNKKNTTMQITAVKIKKSYFGITSDIDGYKTFRIKTGSSPMRLIPISVSDFIGTLRCPDWGGVVEVDDAPIDALPTTCSPSGRNIKHKADERMLFKGLRVLDGVTVQAGEMLLFTPGGEDGVGVDIDLSGAKPFTLTLDWEVKQATIQTLLAKISRGDTETIDIADVNEQFENLKYKLKYDAKNNTVR